MVTRAQRGPLVQALTRANPWWRTQNWEAADPQLTAAARVVCAGCNSDWMARLEARAAPVLTQMIVSATQSLSVIEQETRRSRPPTC